MNEPKTIPIPYKKGRPIIARHSHVCMTYQGREMLGSVDAVVYVANHTQSGYALEVRHFNGESWPIMPRASEVRLLNRLYCEPPACRCDRHDGLCEIHVDVHASNRSTLEAAERTWAKGEGQ